MATSSNRLSCSGVVFVFDLFVWPIRTNFYVYIVIILRTPASRATPSDHCRDENMSRINKKLMQGRSVSVIFTDPTMYHSLYSVSYYLMGAAPSSGGDRLHGVLRSVSEWSPNLPNLHAYIHTYDNGLPVATRNDDNH